MIKKWQEEIIAKSKAENLKDQIITWGERSGVMAVDPSGTSTSAIFYFKNWGEWKFFSFKDKDWIKQVEQLEKWLDDYPPRILLVETGLLFRRRRYDYNMVDLIRVAGALEYLARKRKIEYVRIGNEYWERWGQAVADQGLVEGLELKKIKGPKGWPRSIWHFKEKELNEHEKDALLIFYAWWTKRMGKKWPFSN